MPVIKFTLVLRPQLPPSSGITHWVAKQILLSSKRVFDLPLEDAWSFATRTGLSPPPVHKFPQQRPRSRSVHYDIPHPIKCKCDMCVFETSSICGDMVQKPFFNYYTPSEDHGPFDVVYDPDIDQLKFMDLQTLTGYHRAVLNSDQSACVWDSAIWKEWKVESQGMTKLISWDMQRAIEIMRREHPNLTVAGFGQRFGRVMKALQRSAELPMAMKMGICFPDIRAINPRSLQIDMKDLAGVIEPYDTFKYHRQEPLVSCAQLWHLWCVGFKPTRQSPIRQLEWYRYELATLLRKPYRVLCNDRFEIIRLIVFMATTFRVRPQITVDFLDLVANANTEGNPNPATPWILENFEAICFELTGNSRLESDCTLVLRFDQYDW